MTIHKGADWGGQIRRPSDLVLYQSDAEASVHVTRYFLAGQKLPPIAIRKSNLARALGLAGASPDADRMLATRFDLIRVNYETTAGEKMTVLGLGYAMLRNSWWQGEIVAALNTSFIGDWDCAPRAHPNDGKLDFVTIGRDMKLRDRLKAWQRVRSGTHLPHPNIDSCQQISQAAKITRLTNLIVDSRRVARVRTCNFAIQPDAVTLCW